MRPREEIQLDITRTVSEFESKIIEILLDIREQNEKLLKTYE